MGIPCISVQVPAATFLVLQNFCHLFTLYAIRKETFLQCFQQQWQVGRTVCSPREITLKEISDIQVSSYIFSATGLILFEQTSYLLLDLISVVFHKLPSDVKYLLVFLFNTSVYFPIFVYTALQYESTSQRQDCFSITCKCYVEIDVEMYFLVP